MARTIGKHWRGTPGDFQATCDYCGVQWRRDQLHRDGSGLLACPDEGRGLDTVTLSQGNAANASERRIGRYMRDGANWDHDTASAPPFVPPNAPSPAPQGNVGPTGALSVIVLSWLRSDAVVLDSSGGVIQWTDISGRGNHFTQQATSAPCLYTSADSSLNGNPTVGFNGTTMWLSTALQNNAPMWFWGIIRQDGWVNGTDLFFCSFSVARHTASPIVRLVANVAGADNAGAPIGSWVRMAANGTVAGTDYLKLGSTVTSAAGSGQRNNKAITIGAGLPTGAAASACTMAEFLITAGEPTVAEFLALDAYAAARYPAAAF